jgi:hypothetical protein
MDSNNGNGQMIVTKISAGHQFDLRGEKYTVVGALSIRGKYTYRVREESTQGVRSLNREKLISLQQEGALKFLGVAA